MPRAVLFDVGGTLIHLDRRFVLAKLNELGIPATMADFMRAHGIAAGEVRRIMRSDEPGTDTTRWRAYGAKLLQELSCDGDALVQMQKAIYEKHLTGDLFSYVEEGTIETLEQLRADGLRLGIVSNADGRVASFVEKAGLTKYFEIIVDSGIVGVEKPDPRIFQITLEQMGLQPDDVIYVGDIYEVDVLGARGAGIHAVLLFSGDRDPEWDCDVVPNLSGIVEHARFSQISQIITDFTDS